MVTARISTHQRRSSGNMLVLGAFAIFFVVLFFQLITQANKLFSLGNRYNAAVEAAALAGARDLSKIVIDDPHFGFVSLSDQPSGRMTVSNKGEAMPVRGINTIIAGIRLNAIVARELGNYKMAALAGEDYQAIQQTIKNLGEAWKDALLPLDKCKNLARDVDGNKVCLLKTTKFVFAKYSGAADDDKATIQLELGTLNGGGTTVTAAPTPIALAQLTGDDVVGRYYKSDVDLPVGNLHFVFLPVSGTVSLCPNDAFKSVAQDGAGSALKVHIEKQSNTPLGQNATVCSIAPAYTAPNNGSALIVRFIEGSPDNATSLASLVDARSGDHALIYPASAAGGDYPLEPTASIRETDGAMATSEMVASGLYDWIRSNSEIISLDRLLMAIKSPMLKATDRPPMPAHYFYYFAGDNGLLKRLVSDRSAFPQNFLAENQIVGMHMTMQGNQNIGIKIQDQVRKTGRLNGGKHGGQPLSLEAINRAQLKNQSDNCPIEPASFCDIKAYNLDSTAIESIPDDTKLAVQIEMTATTFAPKMPLHSGKPKYP